MLLFNQGGKKMLWKIYSHKSQMFIDGTWIGSSEIQAIQQMLADSNDDSSEADYCAEEVTFSVYDYHSAELLSGEASDELVIQSMEENAVKASFEVDKWEPNQNGRVVYVMED
jgi:hypothetical protein